MKKSILVLVALLSVGTVSIPAIANASVVKAAPVSISSSTFNTPGVASVINPAGATVYGVSGSLQPNRLFAYGSQWSTEGGYVLNGHRYYKVSTTEYLKDSDVNFRMN